MSTSCAETISMPGTSLRNGDTAAPCITNGERETIPEQRNGIRAGFLNKHSTAVPEDAEPDAEPEEVAPEYVPSFSQATPPSMVTVDFTSITLQWSAVTQTGLSASPPEGTELPSCSIAYSLQMQQVCVRACCYDRLLAAFLLCNCAKHIILQVETRSTATGAELAGMCKSDKWVEVYQGTDLLTQVALQGTHAYVSNHASAPCWRKHQRCWCITGAQLAARQTLCFPLGLHSCCPARADGPSFSANFSSSSFCKSCYSSWCPSAPKTRGKRAHQPHGRCKATLGCKHCCFARL